MTALCLWTCLKNASHLMEMPCVNSGEIWHKPKNPNAGGLTPHKSVNATTVTDLGIFQPNATNQGRYGDTKHMSKTTWMKKRTYQGSKK
jgi:hypothetical protein